MDFTDLEKYRDLRKQFEDETGDHWTNSQGEPGIDYVSWLEQKIVKESDSLPCVRDSADMAKQLYFELEVKAGMICKKYTKTITDEIPKEEGLKEIWGALDVLKKHYL